MDKNLQKFMDTIFIGMNIPNQIKVHLDDKQEIITDGMTENERIAYDLGVSNCLSFMDAMLDTNLNEFVIHIKSMDNKVEEFVFVDLPINNKNKI